MRRKWSKKTVVQAISALQQRGKKLSHGYSYKHYRSLNWAACKHWGSWRKAIEGAGINYEEISVIVHRNTWSEKKIVVAIRKRHRNKLPLNSNHLQIYEHGLYGAAVKYFGGWAQAIAAAGLDYSMLRRKAPTRSWSKEVIVSEIIKRAEAGLTIRGGEVYLAVPNLYVATKRHFGRRGWERARLLAGFSPRDPSSLIVWTRITLVAEIKSLHNAGISLNTGSLGGTEFEYILPAGRKVFGSWARAIRASGLDYSKIRKNRTRGWWTPSRVVMCIKLLAKQGVRLSSKAIQLSRGALFGAAVTHFGTWKNAVEAAGIPYRLHRLNAWSTTDWVQNLTQRQIDETKRSSTHLAKKMRKR